MNTDPNDTTTCVCQHSAAARRQCTVEPELTPNVVRPWRSTQEEEIVYDSNDVVRLIQHERVPAFNLVRVDMKRDYGKKKLSYDDVRSGNHSNTADGIDGSTAVRLSRGSVGAGLWRT